LLLFSSWKKVKEKAIHKSVKLLLQNQLLSKATLSSFWRSKTTDSNHPVCSSASPEAEQWVLKPIEKLKNNKILQKFVFIVNQNT
jgi:hypothetical protein